VIDATTLHVIAVIFFATLIRSAFGFGEALIAVPLLSLFPRRCEVESRRSRAFASGKLIKKIKIAGTRRSLDPKVSGTNVSGQ
jgi:uncharacterized membrane protein YfcA